MSVQSSALDVPKLLGLRPGTEDRLLGVVSNALDVMVDQKGRNVMRLYFHILDKTGKPFLKPDGQPLELMYAIYDGEKEWNWKIDVIASALVPEADVVRVRLEWTRDLLHRRCYVFVRSAPGGRGDWAKITGLARLPRGPFGPDTPRRAKRITEVKA